MTKDNFENESAGAGALGFFMLVLGPLVAVLTGLVFVTTRGVPLLDNSIMVSNCVASVSLVIFQGLRADRLFAKLDGSRVAYALTISAFAVIVSVMVHMIAVAVTS